MTFLDDSPQISADWKPRGKIAVIGNAHTSIQRVCRDHAEVLRDVPMVFGVFDHWPGEPFPADKVFVCVQNLEKMGVAATEILLDRVEGRRGAAQDVHRVSPLEFRVVDKRF